MGRAGCGTGLPDSALVGDSSYSRVADSTTNAFSNAEVIDVDLFEAAQGNTVTHTEAGPPGNSVWSVRLSFL